MDRWISPIIRIRHPDTVHEGEDVRVMDDRILYVPCDPHDLTADE